MDILSFLNPKSLPKEDNKPFALQARKRRRINTGGGRLVLHKRKPLRDPQAATRMMWYRARGMYAPGYRNRAPQIIHDEVA